MDSRINWLLLANAALGNFLAGTASRIFSVSLPTVATSLETTIVGIAWAVIAYVLFRWMSSSPAWSKSHIFAATFGATLACMAAPYLSISSWSRIDVIGVVIFDIVALAVFAVLAKKVFSVSSLPTPAETRARSSDT